MTDQRKPPGKPTPKALLDELTSIRSLLGDADKDVEPSSLLDDDVPLLDPVENPDDSDANQQISLLDAVAAARPEPLNKALSERENPFLPRKILTAPAKPAPASTPTPDHIDDAQLRSLVDEALAEWMPKIERDLRNRLMELLRKPS
jgi:hypothetical protein